MGVIYWAQRYIRRRIGYAPRNASTVGMEWHAVEVTEWASGAGPTKVTSLCGKRALGVMRPGTNGGMSEAREQPPERGIFGGKVDRCNECVQAVLRHPAGRIRA